MIYDALEAAMETDISSLTHKMHSHMEDEKWGGLLEGTSCSGNVGNIHTISLELHISDFLFFFTVM